MKKTYILLATLLAVCTAFPAAVDAQTSKKMTNTITRKIFAAKKNKNKKAPAEICISCGQTIADASQHCSAKDGTGLCSAHADNAATNEPSAETGTCPACGQAYTIDEKYHGVPHVCTPAKKAKKCDNSVTGGNGGEPECGVIFIESPEQEEYRGGNGGEPETNFFFVISEDENASLGGNGGEPEGPYYQEIDEDAFNEAEKLWRADKKANGKPKHSMEYYYKQVTSKKK